MTLNTRSIPVYTGKVMRLLLALFLSTEYNAEVKEQVIVNIK
jgi:hypothetical protein